MQKKVMAVSTTATYEEAAKLMHEHNFSGLPVLNGSGKLVGMLSEKDLFRALYPSYEHYLTSLGIYRDPQADEDKIEEIRKNPVEIYIYDPQSYFG